MILVSSERLVHFKALSVRFNITLTYIIALFINDLIVSLGDCSSEQVDSVLCQLSETLWLRQYH